MKQPFRGTSLSVLRIQLEWKARIAAKVNRRPWLRSKSSGSALSGASSVSAPPTNCAAKNAFHLFQYPSASLGMVNRRPQLRSSGHAMREPRGELLHPARRLANARVPWEVFACLLFIQQHLEIGADHRITILHGRLFVVPGRGVLSDLPENPWISRRRPPDHDRIATGLGHHRRRV